MITIDNFASLLLALNFQQHDKQYRKTFANGAVLIADFAKKKLRYPEKLIINDETTSHFDSPENFVVFECVNRLLEKGYKPEHIELERKWPLGRTQKSGKADIAVLDLQDNVLFIVECKTQGKEYDKEKQRMIANGGQLFSYLQQERATRFLCLYTSDFKDNVGVYENAIIQIKDRPEVLTLVKENPDTLAFITANNATEYHQAWKENFNCYFAPNGIFEDDITAYNPEFKPIKRKDLKPFADKEARTLFNQFEEILRHNNISDKSNAFNRIMSLLLCKILDERKNPDDETDVQIKEGKDTPIEIQDRLQGLYSKGMDEFLNEKIVYFSEKEIESVINDFPIQKARFQLKSMFEQQKFYSSNEFCFQEVHNEKLFSENAKVLNEIIALLQYKQFRYSRQNSEEFKQQKRFLGDFFELLLNTGYKQDAGQFFTPLPIARFIIKCLPLHEKINQNLAEKRPDFLPTVIDYACGSGHFLTEMIEEIQQVIDDLNPEYGEEINLNIAHWQQADWTAKYIYGIEKDYRLARTAKLACFMNGDGESTIIFGNGLEDYNNSEHPFRDSFDFLIANPPYSISRFKAHLNLKRNKFELLDYLTESASEIEVLFIERAKQLLAVGGMAGIILPSSILSNGGIYIKARELLLRHFYFKAIVELGSNTFMATGTNTVILFLEKRDDKTAVNSHYVAEDFIIHNKARPSDFTDTRALWENYTRHIGFELSDYESFINQQPNEVITNSEWFVNYQSWFNGLTEIKNFKSSNRFFMLSDTEKSEELTRRFYEKVLPLEKDKFEFFMIIGEQNTLILRSPEDGKAEKAFLGYEFSKRRGDEGIKHYQDADKKHQTALYDETDLNNPIKVNTLIKAVLKNEAFEIPAELAELTKVTRLLDCFNFERLEFDKAISLSVKKSVFEIESKWALVSIGSIAETSSGGTPLSNVKEYYENGNILWINSGEVKQGIILYSENKITELGLKNSSAKIFPINTVLVAMYGATAGQVGILGVEASTNQAVCGILPNEKTLPKYLFYFLSTQLENLLNIRVGVARLNLSQAKIKDFKIPLPDKDIQEKIVAECETIDNEVLKATSEIERIKIKIDEIISKVSAPLIKLSEITLKIGSGATPRGGESSYKETGIALIRSQNIYDDYFKEEGLAFIDDEQAKLLENVTVEPNDILFNITGASVARCNIVNVKYLPARVNQHVAIIRPTNQINSKYLHRILISPNIKKSLLKIAGGSSTREAITKSQLEEFKIPIPDSKTQKTLVAEIETLENKITTAQKIINESAAKKQAILNSYL
jgi:type I restriction enzyme M protein